MRVLVPSLAVVFSCLNSVDVFLNISFIPNQQTILFQLCFARPFVVSAFVATTAHNSLSCALFRLGGDSVFLRPSTLSGLCWGFHSIVLKRSKVDRDCDTDVSRGNLFETLFLYHIRLWMLLFGDQRPTHVSARYSMFFVEPTRAGSCLQIDNSERNLLAHALDLEDVCGVLVEHEAPRLIDGPLQGLGNVLCEGVGRD